MHATAVIEILDMVIDILGPDLDVIVNDLVILGRSHADYGMTLVKLNWVKPSSTQLRRYWNQSSRKATGNLGNQFALFHSIKCCSHHSELVDWKLLDVTVDLLAPGHSPIEAFCACIHSLVVPVGYVTLYPVRSM